LLYLSPFCVSIQIYTRMNCEKKMPFNYCLHSSGTYIFPSIFSSSLVFSVIVFYNNRNEHIEELLNICCALSACGNVKWLYLFSGSLVGILDVELNLLASNVPHLLRMHGYTSICTTSLPTQNVTGYIMPYRRPRVFYIIIIIFSL